MNSPARRTALFALLFVLAFSGCLKKRKSTVAPQAQAPTVGTTHQPTHTTTEPAPTEPPADATGSTAPTATAPPPVATTPTKPKSKPRVAKNNSKHPPSANTSATGAAPAPSKPAAGQPTTTASTSTPPAANQSQGAKIVVQQAGEAPPSGQISAAGEDADTRSRQSIEQLLQSTDTNLRSISRSLNDNERAMIEQIRNYMAQARTASTDGDLTRANNLALKAHLLSDELVKR
jgi:outer membrane biosynthesis protein TonB